jgi:hypothetical protein
MILPLPAADESNHAVRKPCKRLSVLRGQRTLTLFVLDMPKEKATIKLIVTSGL